MRHFFSTAVFIFLVFPAWAQSVQEQPKSEFLVWNYQVGGEDRLRAEYKNNFDFDNDKKDRGEQFYNRARLNFKATLSDEYLKPKADIFVEGLDTRMGVYRTKRSLSQVDSFDVHQGYFSLYDLLGSGWTIKLGRQEMQYGKGRLVTASTWANCIRSFDAMVARYAAGGFYADFLYGQNVKYRDDYANTSRGREALWGVYGGYQKNAILPLVETYLLTQHITTVAFDQDRPLYGGCARGRPVNCRVVI